MSLTDVKEVWRDNFGEPIDFHNLGVTRSKITVPAGMQLAAKNWYRSAVQLSECPCQLRGQLPKHLQTATLGICIRRGANFTELVLFYVEAKFCNHYSIRFTALRTP